MSLLNYVKLPLINMGILKLNEDPNYKVSYLYYDPVDEVKFLRLCQERKTFPILYKAEFQLASQSSSSNFYDAASSEENMPKNRNRRILPYEDNRVILETTDEFPSDYINASYVNSILRPNRYIVTQGPLESTAGDFWRMIWQERASCIIMLTKTFDFTKKMCFPYWPTHEHGQIEFGGVYIQVESKEVLANYTVQRFTIWSSEDSEDIRQVVHFHYTDWPVYTTPFIPSLLDFRRRLRQIMSENAELANGKTVVHCNDGAGRTGAYLGIDANLDYVERNGMLNVFGYVKTLRRCRHGLVETENQLKFIYDTLEEYLLGPQTWFPLPELPQQIEIKSGKESKIKDDGYRREYQLISRLTPTFSIGDCAGSYRDENRMKNRNISIIAPDNFRPYLTSLDTDFINAVFVDRYREGRSIITEWPMQDTINCFWSMVYDFDVSGVIILDDLNTLEYPSFWPNEVKLETYGVFTVRKIAHSDMGNIQTWVFEVNKKIISLTDLMTGVKAETKTIKFFQLMNWHMEDKIPSCIVSLVDIMVLAEKWREENSRHPLCLVSHDGRSKVGILQTVINSIEQALAHREVDIFTIVRTLRRYRPTIIPNLMEYKFCYDVVLHCVLHHFHPKGGRPTQNDKETQQ